MRLGTVMAPNRETALAATYHELDIGSPAEGKRTIVRRMSDHV